MDGRQRTTVAIALMGALLATFLLHTSMDRTQVARVVPVVVVWGMLVFGLAGKAPSIRHVVIAALLTRVIVVGVPAALSDDVYRYLWEGEALLAGHDPLYASPADIRALDPELAPAIALRVNHPELPSVYPPLAMVWFVGLAVLGGTVATAQLAAALADVVTVWALHRLDARGAWLYALLPLPVLESAAGAHIDVPAVTLTTLALLAFRSARPQIGTGLLVMGLLTKLFPLVLLPTAWRALRGRARSWVPALALVGAAVATAPFLRPAWPAGVVAYGTRWSFNGLLHVPLDAMTGGLARPLLLVAGACIALATAWRARTVVGAWCVLGMVFVAITPTMHPWYALWALVPALALGRREVAAASIFLPISYAVLATWDATTGTWDAGPWLWASTWVPAVGAALAVGWWDHRARMSATEAPS